MKIKGRNKRKNKKVLAAMAALPLVVAALAATTTGAQADTHGVTANQWAASVGGVPISPGDTFDVTGTVALSGTFNGNYTTFSCNFAPGDVTITAPNPVPTAPPGGTISLPVTLPTTLSVSGSANPACTDTLTGPLGDDVTTNGVDWTINVQVPTGTSPSPYTGSLTGSVDIPANALKIENPTFYPGCAIDGPNANDNVAGTYDASTGAVTPSGLPRPIAATVSGPCTLENDTTLDQADLQVTPVIDLVYVP